MTIGNRRKADQLGMAISTASHRLKKLVLFGLAGQLGRDRCYHCGGEIEEADQCSIEHKAPWLYRDTALFWDLDNIAFSHLRCNTTNRITSRYDRGSDIDRRKASQLGMPLGTAMGQLRVAIMHDLLVQSGQAACFRCGEVIAAARELSIEHKTPWLDCDAGLFWDLENVAFPHRRCNSRAASRVRQGQSNGGRYRKIGPPGTAWCGNCRAFLPLDQFNRNRSHWNGVCCWCKVCDRARRLGYYRADEQPILLAN